MMRGTALSQVFTFAASLALARMYDEADFGRTALFVSLTLIFSKLAALRYEFAIVLPKEEKESANVMAVAMFWCTVLSIALLGVFLLFGKQIARLLNAESLGLYLYLVPLSVFLIAFAECLRYYYVRKKTYNFLSNLQLGQTTASLAAQLSLFKVLPAFGLIVGMIVKYATGFILFVKKFMPEYRTWRAQVHRDDMKKVARKYNDFPRISTIQVGADQIQTEGIVFLLASLFGEVLLGSYAFAVRVVKAPAGVIASALAYVFYQKASEDFNTNPESLHSFFKKTSLQLFAIGIIPFTILFFAAPFLFSFIFGENWYFAGEIARILTPWLFLNFILSPISQVPMIVNRQRDAFYLTLAGIVIKLGAIGIGGYYNNAILGFTLLSAGGCMLLLFSWWWYLYIAKKSTAGRS